MKHTQNFTIAALGAALALTAAGMGQAAAAEGNSSPTRVPTA